MYLFQNRKLFLLFIFLIFNPKQLSAQTSLEEAVEKSSSDTSSLALPQQEAYQAVKKGEEEIIKKLLIDKKIDVNFRYSWDNENSLLHLAAQQGHYKITELLLKNKATLEAITSHNETPLHLAAQNGHSKIVELLLKYGAKVDVQNLRKNTPLHLAAQNGHSKIVGLLLKYGAKVDVQNLRKNTPLHLAAQNGHSKIVGLLLNHGAKTEVQNSDQNTPLHLAAKDNNSQAVKLLLKYGAKADVQNSERNTPLHLIAQQEYISTSSTAKLLVNAREVNINAKNSNHYTPLHLAAQSGCYKVAKQLIKKKCQIDATTDNHETPLHLAARNKHSCIRGIKCHYEIIELLLNNKNKANIEAITHNQKETPLHLAAKEDNWKIIELLIKYDANAAAQNFEQNTPLHLAVQKSHYESVEKLLKAKDKEKAIEATNHVGRTPLHLAAVWEELKIMEKLIQVKPDVVNYQDNQGNTPIHYAITHALKYKNKKILTLLGRYAKEINWKIKNNENKTALNIAHDLAQDEEKLNMIEFLKKEIYAPNGVIIS